MRYLVFQDNFFYHTDKITPKLIEDWKNDKVQGIIDLDYYFELGYSNINGIIYKSIRKWGTKR